MDFLLVHLNFITHSRLTQSLCGIFLQYSMATRLSQVINQMSMANDNISMFSKKNAPVGDLADLWRESYTTSRHLSASSETADSTRQAEFEHSSLSVFARENGL
jgi:hypothetical protein